MYDNGVSSVFRRLGSFMLFDLAKMAKHNVSKLLTSTVVPRPIAWVVTQDAQGNNNAAPFSFFNVMSSEPPIIALGVGARDGVAKDTAMNLMRKERAQCVVNLVPYAMLHAMNVTAIDFPQNVDEIQQAGLATLPSTLVAPPRIADSPVALECETRQIVPLDAGHHIILARVLAIHIDDAAVMDVERCYVDTMKLGLIGRMHRAAYSRQVDIIDLPRLSLADVSGMS